MGTTFTHYRASINLAKVKVWELRELTSFLTEEAGEEPPFETSGNFMTFEFVECGDNSYYWSKDFRPLCKEGEAECLEDILRNLDAWRALSLTYLHEWNTGDGGYEEEILPDFVEFAEQIPTLILQEVLAKRLEMSV